MGKKIIKSTQDKLLKIIVRGHLGSRCKYIDENKFLKNFIALKNVRKIALIKIRVKTYLFNYNLRCSLSFSVCMCMYSNQNRRVYQIDMTLAGWSCWFRDFR